MKPLSKRTETFTDSVIRRMTRVCLGCGAVNLSQGFPDFDPPGALTEALAKAAAEGPHQYAVTWGARDFREALAAKQSRFMGMPVDPEREIVVTCGSTEAMMAAMMSVVDPAEKVGVGAVPESSFFREPVNNLIRLHFAKREETLNEALNRLESMKSKMK